MVSNFHILPTPRLKQAARDYPLLEGNLEGWIICCSRRFFPLARRIAGDDSLAEDVLQTSWIKILEFTNQASLFDACHLLEMSDAPMGTVGFCSWTWALVFPSWWMCWRSITRRPPRSGSRWLRARPHSTISSWAIEAPASWCRCWTALM